MLISQVLLCLGLLFGRHADAFAAAPSVQSYDGRAILARYCARCHAIDKSSQSTLRQAPPLRDIYRQYPLKRLEFELSEGIGSRHRDMPQIQFSTEQIEKIMEYLASLVQTD
jgi:mono/diheme cytochrome c family protein